MNEPASTAAPLSPPAPFSPLALVRVMRPKQWTKNAALLVPLVFAERLFQPGDVLHAVLGTVAFCLLASSVYIFNDAADRDRDRLHPEKRHRPIASGALPLPTALGMGVGVLAGSLSLATYVGRPFLFTCLTYLVMQLAYTLKLKHVAVLDVMVIALGFVLRVVAGARAIEVPVSNWLYLCTLCLALFLGFCKRRHELQLLEEGAGAHRANLDDYSDALLDQLIGVTTAMTLVSYSLYTMSEETIRFHHTDNLKLTIPFVIYGVFRYLFLVYKKQQGGSPEKVLLSDVPMLVNVLLFGLVAVLVMYRVV